MKTPTFLALLTTLALLGLSSCGKIDDDIVETPSFSRLYESAIKQAKTLSQNAGTELEGYTRLAKLYDANGHQSEAIKSYQHLCEIDPQNPQWPHARAYLLAGYGNLEEAIPLQRKAMELAPNEIAPALRLGEMYIKQNRNDDARATYEAALKIDPENPYVLLGLARCDITSGDWEVALHRLEKSVSIDPSFKGGWALLSTVLDRLGETELSDIARIRSYGRYIDFPDPWLADPLADGFDPYQLSVAAAISRDPERSRKLLEKAISLDPNSSSYLRQLGNLMQKDGDIDAAKSTFERAVEVDPTDSESWVPLINLLLQQQDYTALGKALDQALTHCPDSGYIHFANGRRYSILGMQDKAKAEFEKAKRIQPKEARSYVHISMIFLMERNYREAKKEMDLARKVEPSNPDVYVMLSQISIATGKQTEARNWIKQLEEIPNHSAEDVKQLKQAYHHAFVQK